MHLGSLAWCFVDSVAWAAAVADTPASNKITGFSGEVMDTSNAAVLPQNQLESSMSAGQVLQWFLLKLLLTIIINLIIIITHITILSIRIDLTYKKQQRKQKNTVNQ